jgi:protein AbiQ
MSKTIRICGIQLQYLDYLRQYDKLVSKDPTQNRKFVGVLLEVNGHSYCAPLFAIDISQEPDQGYRGLLKKQIIHMRANEEAIKKKAKKLYGIVNSRKQPKLNARCCNYGLLEQMSLQFGVTSTTTSQEVATTVQAEAEENK